MINFKKAHYSLKVICLIISIVLFFDCTAYSIDRLRLSLGHTDDTLERIEITALISELENHLNEIIERKHPHVRKVISVMEYFIAHDFDALCKTFSSEMSINENEYKQSLEELFLIYQTLSPEAKEVLKIATIFHDIGSIKNKRDWIHNQIGAKSVKAILRRLNYSERFIEKVSKIILHHGFYSNVGVDYLPKDFSGFTEEEKDILLLIGVFDCSGRATGNILVPWKIQELISIRRTKAEKFIAGKDFYKYRFQNLLSPIVFTDPTQRKRDSEEIMDILDKKGYLTDSFINSWNSHLRIYIFSVFQAIGKTSHEDFVKLVKIITDISTVFRERYPELTESIIDTDLDFMSIQDSKERESHISYIRRAVSLMPDTIDIDLIRKELEENNYTKALGLPIHLELEGNRLIIDLETFSRQCNLCGYKEEPGLLHKKDYKNTNYNLVRCPECGLVYNLPRPTNEELEKYYGIGYYQKVEGRQGEGYRKYLDEADKRIQGFKDNFLASIHKLLGRKKRGKLLDVGSAGGYLLEAAAQERWEEVTGIEPAAEIVKAAQDRLGYTHRVYHKTLEQAVEDGDVANESQDVVTFYNTLEHMRNPKAAVFAANKILKKEGLIAFWMPNIDSVVADRQDKDFYHFEYGHLYSFSVKTLKDLLERNGFEVIFIETPAPALSGEERTQAEKNLRGEYMKIIAKKVDNVSKKRLSGLSFQELYDLFPEGREKVHSGRVSRYAMRITKELGLKNELVEIIGRVSAVHDIGGLYVPIDEHGRMLEEAEMLAKKYNLPVKANKEASLKTLSDLFNKRPELARYRLKDDDKFYMSMANIIVKAEKIDGYILSDKQVEALHALFSHERYSINYLHERGIILTPAEEFLIVNHFYYPRDFKGLKEISKTSNLTTDELKLLLDTLIFCDVFENGNNRDKLVNIRNINNQPLQETFKIYKKFYGDKGLSEKPKMAMIKLLKERDKETEQIICEGRQITSIPSEELEYAISYNEYSEKDDTVTVDKAKDIEETIINKAALESNL